MTLGSCAELEVLKFTLDEFTFHWTKYGSKAQIKIASEPNTLSFQSVSEKDFGYYRCDVKDSGKVVLTVFRALYNTTCHLSPGTQENVCIELAMCLVNF